MRGIVGPCASSIQAADTAGVEIVPVNEAVIDNNVVAAPAGTANPIRPSHPSRRQNKIPSGCRCQSRSKPARRRVKPTRIWIVQRRPPDVRGIVIGQVDHLRISGLDHDDGLPGVVGGGNGLLGRRGQFPCLLRLEPHALHGVHHVGLADSETRCRDWLST